jgi:hypothetical protein
MNRQRNRRSLVTANRARRIRPTHLARQVGRVDRDPPLSPADEAAIAFLAEILVGDSAWTVAEVQRVISLRESAGLDRRRVAAPDDGTLAP